jgi:hypothetical protein
MDIIIYTQSGQDIIIYTQSGQDIIIYTQSGHDIIIYTQSGHHHLHSQGSSKIQSAFCSNKGKIATPYTRYT